MSKNNEKYYSIIEDKATKSAEVLIYGVIGDSWWEESITARKFVSDFRKLEKENDIINIRINSPGGSVYDGLAIFNAISGSAKEVHTYNDGLCASMAAVLLLAPKPENVHPAQNSLLMLHSPSTGAWGNRLEIEKAIEVLDKVQLALVKSICEKTGLDEKEVEENYFDYKDHWLTADEAREAGLYKNVEEHEAENIPQNASTMKFSDLVKLYEPTNSAFSQWINKLYPSSSSIVPTTETNEPETEETETPTIDQSIPTDMDIQKIRDAYGLTEDKYNTEDALLAFIASREKEMTNLVTAKEQAETDLATANQTIASKDAEIAALKQEPGAQSATVNLDTNPSTPKEDVPAATFGEAFAKCMELSKK